MKVWREIFNLLVPSSCATCGRNGWSLCDTCRSQLNLCLTETHRANLAGFRLTTYSAEIADQLSQFKEQGVTELAAIWLDQVDFGQLVETLKFDLCVPLPSSKESNRERGFTPAVEIAKQLRNQLAAHGRHPMVVSSGLRRNLTVIDQASLAVDQRWANMTGQMFATADFKGKTVLLVDDVVTTGASMLEAARALELAGAEVVGFFCIAETLLKDRSKFL